MKVIKPSYQIQLTLEQGIQIVKNIEKYGRTCYKSTSELTEETSKRFVPDKIKSGHECIIEHEKVTVIIVCDRGVTHELVRHRIGAFSQESTRYCNYSKDKFGNELTFIKPIFFEEDTNEYRLWEHSCRIAEKNYMLLIDAGRTPQEARSILPNSLKTEIVITFDLREWRHFFKLRALGLAGTPHPQMLELTVPMLFDFDKLVPGVFSDLVKIYEEKNS